MIAIALLFFLPQPIIPADHSLAIAPQPSEAVQENHIEILGITKLLNTPSFESAHVNLSDLELDGSGQLTNEGKLLLSDGAVARYDSFFAGCISIFLRAPPESHLVNITFDQIEQRYSLYGEGAGKTEVKLCAPISITRLNFKWGLFVSVFYFSCFWLFFFSLLMGEMSFYFLFHLRIRIQPDNSADFIGSHFLFGYFNISI